MTSARNLVSEGVSPWSRRAFHARHGSPTQGAAESRRSFRGRPNVLVLAQVLPLIVMAFLLPAMAFSGTLTVTKDTQLRENHVGPIVIAADGVTLNCKGHWVDGEGGDFGILIESRTDVTVKNCRITNSAAAGLAVHNSSRITLRNNVAKRNPGGGFQLVAVSDSTVEENTASENAFDGFHLESCEETLFKENAANDNVDGGFFVGFSNQNRLVENIAHRNGGFGIFLFQSSDNRLRKNSACKNPTGDLLEDEFSSGNTFIKNRFCVVVN